MARLGRPHPGPELRVGLAAADPGIRWFRTRAADTTLAVLRGHARRVERLAADGARLVVPPEKLVGVAICKDLDFPAWTLRYARRGVDVMAVPAWDFGADGWLHSRMAVLRGVEGGFSVARAAQGTADSR